VHRKTPGQRILEDEMSYPDWPEKMERGLRDLAAGRFIELDALLKQSSKKRHRLKRRK
jgi:hypothetical protein